MMSSQKSKILRNGGYGERTGRFRSVLLQICPKRETNEQRIQCQTTGRREHLPKRLQEGEFGPIYFLDILLPCIICNDSSTETWVTG